MRWAQLFWPRGRLNRSPYWITLIALNLGFGALNAALPQPSEPTVMSVSLTMFNLLGLYVSACAFIARLHDQDRTGWWTLPIFSVLTLALVARELESQTMPAAVFIPLGVAALVAVVALLYVAIKPGTPGPNRFGPNPL